MEARSLETRKRAVESGAKQVIIRPAMFEGSCGSGGECP